MAVNINGSTLVPGMQFFRLNADLVGANALGIQSVFGKSCTLASSTVSAAPGGTYSTVLGSYFLIYPIGVSGANVNVGIWA